MKKTVTFIALILSFAFAALPPAYAASHEKPATTSTDSASDGKKDKKEGEEDEEPECD